MTDGQPRTTVVWCSFDGTHVLINVMRGFRKEKNMRRNPRVTVLCYDPRQPLRGTAERSVVKHTSELGASRARGLSWRKSSQEWMLQRA
jgi:hypothetical protein